MAKGRYSHMGKLGLQELGAFWRQGLAEVRGMFYQGSRIAQPPDPAMPGVISHGEAADIRRSGHHESHDHEKPRESVLDKHDQARGINRDEGPAPTQARDEPARDAQSRDDHQQTGPDIDKD